MMDRKDRLRTAASRAAAIGATAATLAAAIACAGPRASAGAGSDPPTVAVAAVTRGDLAETLTLAAEFRPFQEIDVHAKVAGYLKAIYVDVGDRVKTGQLLAVLEIPELQDELQEDEAAVKRNAEEINRARADLDRTESAHEIAHLGAARLAAVLKSRPNLIAQQDIDDAASRDRVAEAQIATARAALAAAEQQLAVSRAAANKSKTLLEYSRIIAPFAGVVTHRYADVGAMIQAGTSSQTQAMPLVRLSDNSLLRLTIPVPESAVPRIRVGEPVDVRVLVLDKKFPGTVARLSERVDEQTRTMHTEVDVKNPSLELVPGMYAQTELRLDETSGAIVVPVQAIDRGEAGASVLIVNDRQAIERRAVTLGLETADRVEIRSGLREGDRVVMGNRSQLKPGQTVAAKLADPPSEGAK